MIQLSGPEDIGQQFPDCETNPEDPICEAYNADYNEIQMEEEYVGRDPAASTGEDALAAMAQGFTFGAEDDTGARPRSNPPPSGGTFPWKTVGLVVGAVAVLGGIGYVMARR